MSDHLVLGIETSGIRCSVAWWQKDTTLLEYNLDRKNEHAVLLATFIEKGFKELGIEPKSVTHVAVGSGPGSFTGLRIGMSYAKGFCYGYNIPLIPVTNFELLSDLEDNIKIPVYTLIEAGRGNYYVGIFNTEKSKLDQKYLSPISQLEQLSPNVHIIVYEENSEGYIRKFLSKTAKISDGKYSAARLCALGYYKYQRGSALELNEIEPLYLQNFAGVP